MDEEILQVNASDNIQLTYGFSVEEFITSNVSSNIDDLLYSLIMGGVDIKESQSLIIKSIAVVLEIIS